MRPTIGCYCRFEATVIAFELAKIYGEGEGALGALDALEMACCMRRSSQIVSAALRRGLRRNDSGTVLAIG